MKNDYARLIEHGFPCHQVGAETQRERGASSALPPLYYLHVWWARRPLTPSRAAILASLLPADTDPERFVRSLGIEKCVAFVDGQEWTLTGNLLDKIQTDNYNEEYLPIDSVVLRALDKEQQRRKQNRRLIAELKAKDSTLENDPVLKRWEKESQSLPEPYPEEGTKLYVKRVMGDPAWFKQIMALAQNRGLRVPNLYGYERAFSNIKNPDPNNSNITILDPTAGGGSIPFEALRLGYKVIANELNPVASLILYATLAYPLKFGLELYNYISIWGERLVNYLENVMVKYFPKNGHLAEQEKHELKKRLNNVPNLLEKFDEEEVTTYLYCRQVTCPNCLGEAPLLNSCWLSKESGKQWGVRIISDGNSKGGNVRFETYRVDKNKGPNGENPNFSTVSGAVGQCIHCRQAISGDEIKAQARGESRFGQWKDRLYCVVAVRHEPKLDKNGQPQCYASGKKKGQIKTQKIRFFRPPNEQDLKDLQQAEKNLNEKWDDWLAKDYIPIERIPAGHKTSEPLRYGMPRWCDMFTPRQLLGHCTLVEGLNELKPRIINELGEEKGRAVITYLQFAIDKILCYNSIQTMWHVNRGVMAQTFTRHDFSLKWTFGEMIFSGRSSGFAWGLNQILDSYEHLAKLLSPACEQLNISSFPISITQQSANKMHQIKDNYIDLVVIDPPYYNNVQYAELSDYFYVWQKRTLKDLYPNLFSRRLTNKKEEAVANPARDGSIKSANQAYVNQMAGIFAECRRVLKKDGLLTLMFNHKSQEAWEALTRALVESDWIVSSTFPVESEPSQDIHHKDMAATASSIFISCRKRTEGVEVPAVWTGIGGRGVQKKIELAVKQGLKEFEPLRLNPVDEMVASYGRALKVLSENWPVMDGDEEVSPIRAMNEASRVVAENQIARLSKGRIQVNELDSETAMALTAFGIWGLNEFSFDQGLNLSRSLQIQLAEKNGGYQVQPRAIGLNTETRGGRSQRQASNSNGYHAPLVKKGSKLRLAKPEERNEKRFDNPQTDWDILEGILAAYEKGDILMVRPYLEKHAGNKRNRLLDMLQVWAAEVDDPVSRQKAEMILFGLRQ